METAPHSEDETSSADDDECEGSDCFTTNDSPEDGQLDSDDPPYFPHEKQHWSNGNPGMKQGFGSSPIRQPTFKHEMPSFFNGHRDSVALAHRRIPYSHINPDGVAPLRFVRNDSIAMARNRMQQHPEHDTRPMYIPRPARTQSLSTLSPIRDVSPPNKKGKRKDTKGLDEIIGWACEPSTMPAAIGGTRVAGASGEKLV